MVTAESTVTSLLLFVFISTVGVPFHDSIRSSLNTKQGKKKKSSTKSSETMKASAMMMWKAAALRNVAPNSSMAVAVRGRAADRLSNTSIVTTTTTPTIQLARSLTIAPSSRVTRAVSSITSAVRPLSSRLVDSLIDLPISSNHQPTMGTSGSKCPGSKAPTSDSTSGPTSPPHLTGCRSIASVQPKSHLCCSCIDLNAHSHSTQSPFSFASNPLLGCACAPAISSTHHHLPYALRPTPLWTTTSAADRCCDQLSPASPHQHSPFCVHSGQGHVITQASVSTLGLCTQPLTHFCITEALVQTINAFLLSFNVNSLNCF